GNGSSVDGDQDVVLLYSSATRVGLHKIQVRLAGVICGNERPAGRPVKHIGEVVEHRAGLVDAGEHEEDCQADVLQSRWLPGRHVRSRWRISLVAADGSGERVHFEAGKSKRIPTQCTQRKVRANTSVPQRQDGRYRIKRNYSPVLRDAGGTGAAFSVVAGAVFGKRQPAAVVDFRGWDTVGGDGAVRFAFQHVNYQCRIAGAIEAGADANADYRGVSHQVRRMLLFDGFGLRDGGVGDGDGLRLR